MHAYCTWWADLAALHGAGEVLVVLACEGGWYGRRHWRRIGRTWWRSSSAGWTTPAGGATSQIADAVRRLPQPAEVADRARLHRLLLDGPDLLSAEAARYCLHTGLGALLPTDYGRPAQSRTARPVGSLMVVECPWGRAPCESDAFRPTR